MMAYFILRPVSANTRTITYRVCNRRGYKSKRDAIQDSNNFYGKQTIVVHESELPRFVSVNEMLYVWTDIPIH